jgi:hypothetical protein
MTFRYNTILCSLQDCACGYSYRLIAYPKWYGWNPSRIKILRPITRHRNYLELYFDERRIGTNTDAEEAFMVPIRDHTISYAR